MFRSLHVFFSLLSVGHQFGIILILYQIHIADKCGHFNILLVYCAHVPVQYVFFCRLSVVEKNGPMVNEYECVEALAASVVKFLKMIWWHILLDNFFEVYGSCRRPKTKNKTWHRMSSGREWTYCWTFGKNEEIKVCNNLYLIELRKILLTQLISSWDILGLFAFVIVNVSANHFVWDIQLINSITQF